MMNNILKKKPRKNKNRLENIQRSKEIKKIIAQECDIDITSVHNKTYFMSGQNISYFDSVDVLYILQKTFNVRLPESSYTKYRTVGDLIKDVNRQVRKFSR